MPVVTAFSVSEQITNVGAYAGLASILGLAVLSLLYFGQARELRRLRDWAGRAPERTVELQEQADQAAAAIGQRRPAPPAAQAAGAPRAAAAAPAAASVRAGPATQAATAAGAAGAAGSVAPPGSPAAVPGSSAPPGAPTAAPGSVAVPGAPAVPAPETPSPAAPGDGPVTWAPSPTAAGTPAAGTGQETQALPVLPTGAPLPDAVPSVVAPVPIGPDGPPTGDSPVPLRQVHAGAGAGLPRRRATPEPPAPAGRSGSGGDERRGGRRVGILAGGAALLLLVIVLATQVLGGDDKPARNAKTDTGNTIVPPASSAPAKVPAVTPGDFQVFVLNGTTQNGIAAEFAKKLETAGYVSAGTGNAAVNTEATTTVFYADGKKSGATAVAKELGVKVANVKAADAGVTAGGKGADVFVQIGADKATP